MWSAEAVLPVVEAAYAMRPARMNRSTIAEVMSRFSFPSPLDKTFISLP